MNKALSDNDLVEKIYSNHFIHVRMPDDQKSLIHCLIKEKIPSSNPHAWKTYENWIMKERQAKFIVNSTKVYLYFGYDYIMPFWDKRLLDFFPTLPFRMKLNKQLYDDVLKKSFFNEQGLNFNEDIHIGFFTRLFQYIINSVKSLLPYSLVTLLTDQKNIVLYDEITKELREDMDNENVIRPIQANFYNSYLIQWYLFRTRELVSSLK